MRRLSIAVLAVVAASPAAAEIDYAAPLNPSAAAFKERFAGRRATCQAEATMRLGLDKAHALSFCDCQIDVFARGLTPEEMKAVELATFGSDDEADANAAAAISATSRLIPERKRKCGY